MLLSQPGLMISGSINLFLCPPFYPQETLDSMSPLPQQFLFQFPFLLSQAALVVCFVLFFVVGVLFVPGVLRLVAVFAI